MTRWAWSLGLLIFAAVAWPACAQQSPAGAYAAATGELAAHSDGFGLDQKPGSTAILDRYWRAAETWSAQWLQDHTGDSQAGFQAAAVRIDPEVRTEMQPLGRDLWLVALAHDEIGIVFLLSKDSNGLGLAWSIDKAVIPAGFPNGQAVRDWKPDAGRLQYGSIKALPTDAFGRRRFYVDATFAQHAGATVGQTFSVWAWDGEAATPLLAKPYAVMADQNPPQVVGNQIEIPAKGELKRLFACGACVGREMRITIDLDPQGAARLVGERSMTPELDVIDELYDRVVHHRPADDIADFAVIAALSKLKPDELGGFIDEWSVNRSGSHEIVCLAADDTRLFTLSRTSERLRIVRLRESAYACPRSGRRP
jgi:hypothetical protein